MVLDRGEGGTTVRDLGLGGRGSPSVNPRTTDADVLTAIVAVLRADAPHQQSNDCDADQRHQNDVEQDHRGPLFAEQRGKPPALSDRASEEAVLVPR